VRTKSKDETERVENEVGNGGVEWKRGIRRISNNFHTYVYIYICVCGCVYVCVVCVCFYVCVTGNV
jgi:hypothetical protein